jgi:hypothetical protein
MPPAESPAKANLRQAVGLAASNSPPEHDQLYALLNSKAFLLSLEPEKAYQESVPRHLQVARVIKTLMDSPHAIARGTLARLVRAQDYLSYEQLSDLLIIAHVVVRPLPPSSVAFLDSRSTPDSAGLHLVMTTLAANESEPALLLFERKIADPSHEVETRAIWLRVEYLTRRNNVPILRSYKRMIVEGSVPAEMRLLALESLCSYDPQWYLACTKPEPPLRAFASDEAKGLLREILAHAKERMELSAELKLAVDRTSLEIGGR